MHCCSIFYKDKNLINIEYYSANENHILSVHLMIILEIIKEKKTLKYCRTAYLLSLFSSTLIYLTNG